MKRFWSKVLKGDGCWVWTGYKSSGGYGRFRYKGKTRFAHRVAFSLVFGEIPRDICVLHKCDNRECVNPSHLFLGTRDDNNKDRHAKGRDGHTMGRHGEFHPRAKLAPDTVLLIRREYQQGGVTQQTLARKYNIAQSHICNLVKGRKWGHIGRESN